jgi:3-hydroxyacyl-[acyl-carrier-protein] dehydratase
MPPQLMIDLANLDFAHPVADIEAIRRVLPQRYEMEQLTGILRIELQEKLIVAYKDVRPDEFWVRGHMPDFPLMPGVLMCEAAAQLCSYYINTQGLMSGDFVAFGGLENVKFRGAVRPGDRFILAAQLLEYRAGRRAKFSVQGIVGNTLVFHGDVVGVPFSKRESKFDSTDSRGTVDS